LAVGARRPHAALIECWQSIEAGLAEILAVCDRHGSQSGAARHILGILEEGLLRVRDTHEGCALRAVHGFDVALDAPMPLLAPAAHVDRVFLRVRSGAMVVDDFCVPGRVSLAPGEVARRLLVRWGAAADIDEVPGRRWMAAARAAWCVARNRYADKSRPDRLRAALAAARVTSRLLAQARRTSDEALTT
jgi:hypothetical protein